MSFVVPAVLPSSRKDLEEKLALFAGIPSVTRVQIDIVDGKFALPASWPYHAPGELRSMVETGEMLPQLDRIEYEIDLMCFDPEHASEAWIDLGAARLTFHAESATDFSLLLASARTRYGSIISYGVALNLASDLSLIERNLGQIDYVQFMGIARIGRQGQPFDERVYEKIRIFHARHPEIPIQIDGGVSLENAKKLALLGVSNLVAGSSILRAIDPVAAVAAIEALQTSYGV